MSSAAACCRLHRWSTGQDQVAAIKRQLCLLVPGIYVFLDVDGAGETRSSRGLLSSGTCKASALR